MKMMIKLTAKTTHKMALRQLLEETQKYLTVGDFFVYIKPHTIFVLYKFSRRLPDFSGGSSARSQVRQAMTNICRL